MGKDAVLLLRAGGVIPGNVSGEVRGSVQSMTEVMPSCSGHPFSSKSSLRNSDFGAFSTGSPTHPGCEHSHDP